MKAGTSLKLSQTILRLDSESLQQFAVGQVGVIPYPTFLNPYSEVAMLLFIMETQLILFNHFYKLLRKHKEKIQNTNYDFCLFFLYFSELTKWGNSRTLIYGNK